VEAKFTHTSEINQLYFVEVWDLSTWSSGLTIKKYPKGKPFQGSTVPLSLHHVHMKAGPLTGTCWG